MMTGSELHMAPNGFPILSFNFGEQTNDVLVMWTQKD
jgi:hypothetical protein